MFAALAAHPDLCNRVSAFVALSPAVVIRGIAQPPLQALVSSSQAATRMIFGTKCLLGMAEQWAHIASPQLYRSLIDMSMRFLFAWSTSEISPKAKLRLYQHLYSTSSVKCLQHFLQIARVGRLVAYNDHDSSSRSRPIPYDVGTISCPLAVFLGESDTILDIPRTVAQLPKSTLVAREPKYEHLDTIWADNAPTRVFPAVLAFLDTHAWNDATMLPETAARRACASIPSKPTLHSGAVRATEGRELFPVAASLAHSLDAESFSMLQSQLNTDPDPIDGSSLDDADALSASLRSRKPVRIHDGTRGLSVNA